MTMRLNYLLGISFVGLIFACSNSKPDNADFTEESFPKTFFISEGRIYKNDSLFLGHPTLLRFHPDSFLIIEEYGTPKLIKIIDLKSGDIHEIIQQGKGPGEMIVSWGPEILGDSLYAFCGELRKVIIFAPDNKRKFILIDEFNLEEKASYRFYPLTPEMHVCLSNIGDERRLTFLDEKGKIIKKMGDYPSFLNSDEIKPDNEIFLSSISSTPDGNKIVLACIRTDVLEIYDTYNGLIKRLQGPLGIKLSVSRHAFGNGYMNRVEPGYFTYSNVIANEHEFWVDYNGYKSEKGKQPSFLEQYSKQIYCFNWNGKPLKKIEFDFPIMTFDVDWVGKMLYTIIWKGENPEIIVYSLNEIL